MRGVNLGRLRQLNQVVVYESSSCAPENLSGPAAVAGWCHSSASECTSFRPRRNLLQGPLCGDKVACVGGPKMLCSWRLMNSITVVELESVYLTDGSESSSHAYCD